MQLIEGQVKCVCVCVCVCVFFIKRRQIDKIELEFRVLELEGQINVTNLDNNSSTYNQLPYKHNAPVQHIRKRMPYGQKY